MAISKEEVEHVAKLARLDLTEEDKAKFAEQLSKILEYAKKLDELDTDKIEATTHVMQLANVMREDIPRPSWPLEKMMLNAPDMEDGQIKVPAVLD